MLFNLKRVIEKCKKRNKKAQKQLYEKYSAMFYAICYRYAKSEDEASDILQDGFLKIFLNIEKYTEGNFEAWMRRIIINTAISHYHHNLKHYYHQDIDKVDDLDHDSVNETDYTMDELLNIIKTLPDGYRLIFNLYAVEGYKHKEISEMLEIDLGTSKSQYSRARKLVREKLLTLKKEEKVLYSNY